MSVRIPAAGALAASVAWSAAAAQGDAPLRGRLVDATTSQPVVAALVACADAPRTARSDADGRFRLDWADAGRCRLRVRRLGYRSLDTTLVRHEGAEREVMVPLTPAVLALASVTVLEDRRAAVQPAVVLEGAALDRQLAPSIAATIAGEPGVTARFNGPLATQPVVRGLTGDRVPVLEDGQRTGDIATTAPDHAVTIDPIVARRIEIVRGPAALLYGSSTLGGVVNVAREDIPRAVPRGVTGSLVSGGESLTTGGSLGGEAAAGRGALAVRAFGNARTGNDTRTPGGRLPFTDHDGYEVGAGASLSGARGYAGVAVRDFRTFYGVPSSYAGVTLPGAHVGGVYIDLRRSTARAEAQWRPSTGPVSSLAATGQYVRFEQDEFERGGFVGTRFGQLAASGDLVARYGGTTTDGRPRGGAIGMWGQWRDFRATGSYTGTRPATLHAAALYLYDERPLGPLQLAIGARWDQHRIAPLDSTETRLLRDIRTRRFGTWSGAASARLPLGAGLTMGGGVARAFRAPAIEELYSAGPHLATYAFEVGNPALGAEVGTGGEVFAEWDGRRGRVTATAFRNAIGNFIYYAPVVDGATGLPVLDSRLRRYPVYQASQADAVLEGVEARAQLEVARGLALDATTSWVRGSARAGGQPLPAMPPLRARVALSRESPRWSTGLTLDGAAAQRRVPTPAGVGGRCNVNVAAEGIASLLPAEFCPTPAFLLVHLTLGRRFTLGRRLHAVTLGVDNLFDSPWRDHLWRAKQVAIQPGRNVRALYRITF
jgi:iron complex outermembrane receptor protein